MSKTNSKAIIAKALYLSGNKVEHIAEILSVTPRTIQTYKAKALKAKDDWDAQKVVKYLDNSQKDQESIYADFVEHMYEELRNIRQDKDLSTKERIEALSRLGDSFSKMRNIAAVENPEAYKHGIIKATVEMFITIIKPVVSKECLIIIAEELEAHQEDLADVTL